MELLTVGEMARRSGVPATTLRYYDSVGLLHPVRLANSHRRYPADTLDRLQAIRLCQELGCDLDEIRELIEPHAREARRLAAKRELLRVERQFLKLATVRAVLEHVEVCQCDDLSECRADIQRALARLTPSAEDDELARVARR